jgi:hypothetical protein
MAVKNITGISLNFSLYFIYDSTSKPFISGISMSKSIKSGFTLSRRLIAFSPEGRVITV